MLRSSTELIQRSLRTYVPVIESLVTAPAELWTLDADGYDEAAIELLLGFASRLRPALHEGASDILVTKVMLGTFGCVPAFDSQFKKGFAAATFGPKALRRIGRIYSDHAQLVEAHRVGTLAFETGQATQRQYTRAQVIDMVFFTEGGNRGEPGRYPWASDA